MLNLWFPKMSQENPKLRDVSFTRCKIMFNTVNGADVPLRLKRSSIIAHSAADKDELFKLKYKTSRLVE